MKRLERVESPIEALRIAMEGAQAKLWTTLPGIIQSFDPLQMTVVVQPAIQVQLTNATDEKDWITMPLLLDVPVVIQSAGGMSITIPITKGDECLVSFSSRCIDGWWGLGGVQVQTEYRMHDLSDGFAFIGPRSLPRIIANYSTTSLQIRSDDGIAVVDINPTTHAIVMTSPSITVNGPLTVNGVTTINGNVATTGTLKNNTKEVGSPHQHLNSGGSGLGGVPQ